ncbi:MAG: gliding motility-associated ABC transporter permease subunit GldF [Bacteroidales bacterium]|nr:gliding motility-associated ABC transporter permease subunit GldF [Bacteroidales bacterium]
MWILLKKEVNGFLNSLLGYIVISVFLLVNGLFLWIFPIESNILDYGYANIDGLFMIGPFVFLFLIPAITMRFFSEENRSGTIELLMTRPLTDLQVILAKYLAGLILVVISILPTLIYFFSVYQLGFPKGNIDTGGMWGSYIGLLFLGASFVAIGLFASSLTDNQIIAFILAIVLSGFIYIGFEFMYNLSLFGNADLLVKTLGISTHYSAMSKGVIDTRDLIYFMSVIALFLLLTKFSVESRKW